MRRMGFDERWASLFFMSCKSSVTYSVLISRELKGLIRPTRRLRQGNPIPISFFYVHNDSHANLERPSEKRPRTDLR